MYVVYMSEYNIMTTMPCTNHGDMHAYTGEACNDDNVQSVRKGQGQASWGGLWVRGVLLGLAESHSSPAAPATSYKRNHCVSGSWARGHLTFLGPLLGSPPTAARTTLKGPLSSSQHIPEGMQWCPPCPTYLPPTFT